MIDTAGKEEHLIDQLIHPVNLSGTYLLCQVLAGLWDTHESQSPPGSQAHRVQYGHGRHCGPLLGEEENQKCFLEGAPDT